MNFTAEAKPNYYPEPIPKKWPLVGALTTLIANPIIANIETARASFRALYIVTHGGLRTELANALNVVDHAKRVASLTNIFEFGNNVPIHSTELVLAAFTLVGQYAHPTRYSPQENIPSWLSESSQKIHTILAPATTYLAVATVNENMARIMTHQTPIITAAEGFAIPYAAFSLYYAGKRMADWLAHPTKVHNKRVRERTAARNARKGQKVLLTPQSEAEIRYDLLGIHAKGHGMRKGVKNKAQRMEFFQQSLKSLEDTQPIHPGSPPKSSFPLPEVKRDNGTIPSRPAFLAGRPEPTSLISRLPRLRKGK